MNSGSLCSAGLVMQPYRDLSGGSGVTAYALGPDAITVCFKGGATYLYTHASAGRRTVEHMKRLAAAGDGLATFINRRVHHRYAVRLDDGPALR